jgi:gamma-glutamyltranspeptidase/glutathione hydrolase
VGGHYRGARIVSGSPPTSGGIALIDALNILEGFDLEKVDKVTRTQLIVEAMRRVHRDRAVYLGDPDFVEVPVERLINPYYAAGQRASIRMDKATPSGMLPGVDAPSPGPSTTHFSVIDARGNMVAATITLNFFFGSGLMIPGTGILLNNQMDDFSVKPGVPNGFQLIGADANAIQPAKRPLSSSTPTIVAGPNGLMILGSPGGSYIPGMVILGAAIPSPVLARRVVFRDGRAHARGTQGTRSARAHAARRLSQVGQHAGGHLGLQDRQGGSRFRSARRGRGACLLNTAWTEPGCRLRRMFVVKCSRWRSCASRACS